MNLYLVSLFTLSQCGMQIELKGSILLFSAGVVFIHCIPTSRAYLDDPPSISEGWGGRITDYRIAVSTNYRLCLVGGQAPAEIDVPLPRIFSKCYIKNSTLGKSPIGNPVLFCISFLSGLQPVSSPEHPHPSPCRKNKKTDSIPRRARWVELARHHQ